VQNKEYKLAT